MLIVVMVLPVGVAVIHGSLLIEVNIHFNVVDESTLPLMLERVLTWHMGLLMIVMVPRAEVFVVHFIMRAHFWMNSVDVLQFDEVELG